MKPQNKWMNEFSKQDIASLEPAMKIGILGTVTPDGLPHLTMISTLKASSATRLSFGQFMEGRSKEYLRQNPKTGWLVMTLDRQIWRGSATFTHTARSGVDYDFYNNSPLFRYNAYFGIHTIYYLDLLAQSGVIPLPMNAVVQAALKTMLARSLPGKKSPPAVLNRWTMGMMNKLDNLKFLGYIGGDGYPVVIPCIQAQAADAQRILFSASVFSAELEAIPKGAPLAVFCMSLDMEDVLIRGNFTGLRRIGGLLCGEVQVDWVYNPMPPVPGQIYPPLPIVTVTEY
ncbi:MAG: hypothetical protein A2W35_05565 [Chloroflexi bacterium RBG_16_57_11]|nr:MAG: hypothetical protein A2W35_05565 [Chloroflexi bacterium RBG_16_57_11]